ncbi:hypothetical protein Sden_1364 [Shewanella denitrificans OS217]|jgi:hypothetical protein|uniref:Uncharacterized protein n=1 Tax=Shewanella denitrificans (strain OS217 / ATCC BAA-1090 / DSM 15013) TaxID=318161 RepID=Q12PH6_SHEDO|nr:hypothetical protein [Shewanella denitrificans]ABE54650.1 hypothetical protein Sden_1364 [Shewanella denitrificans OS217]
MTHNPAKFSAHTLAYLTKGSAAKHLGKVALCTGILAGMLTLSACQSAQATMTDIDSLTSADTNVELKSMQQITVSVEQDSNDITQAKVNVDGQDYEVSFTAQELSNPDLLQQRLDILPAQARESLIKALNHNEPQEMAVMHETDLGSMSFVKFKELNDEDKAKLAKLHQELNHRQHAIEKHVQSININTSGIDAISAEMEQLSKQLAIKTAQHEQAKTGGNSEEIERIAAKLSEKGREIERLMGGKHEEVRVEIHKMSAGIEDLVEQIVALETQGRSLDGEHKVIVIKQDGEDAAQGITKLIKNLQLTDEQKQQMKAALN